MIQFAAWTGIRAGELHAMRWEDIEDDAARMVKPFGADFNPVAPILAQRSPP